MKILNSLVICTFILQFISATKKHIEIDIEVRPIDTRVESGLNIQDEEVRLKEDVANNFELSLVNYFNAQYIGHLLIGGKNGSTSDLQKIKMIYDTGSHWTWVQLESCNHNSLCTKELEGYDPSRSDFVHRQQQFGTDETISLNYGVGYAKGYLVTDRVCLGYDQSSCSNQYKMLDVYEAQDLANVRSSGLVGMSPAQDSRNNRFIDDLKENGVIEQRIFSFYITNYFEAIQQIENSGRGGNIQPEDIAPGSKLVIGGYDVEQYTPEGKSEIFWLPLSQKNSNYWTVEMPSDSISLDFGANGIQSIKSNSRGVVMDSGTSFIIIPKYDYNHLLEAFNYKLQMYFEPINEKTQIKQADCTDGQYESMPDMVFTINDISFKLPKTSYIYRISEQNKCFLLLVPRDFFSTPMYILGNIFLHNFYTIYDLEEQRIGLSTAKKVNYGSEQMDNSSEGQVRLVDKAVARSAENYKIKAIGYLFCFVILILLVYIFMQKRGGSQDTNEEQIIEIRRNMNEQLLHTNREPEQEAV